MPKKDSSSFTTRLTRRDLLLQMGALGLIGTMERGKAFALFPRPEQQASSQVLASSAPLSAQDDAFLEDLERKNFQYFWDQASPDTGLVRDRCNIQKKENSVVASIAATGFGLTALCIAQQRDFLAFEDARDRVLATLRFLWKKMPTHRGFFYHFADINTGERVWDSEVSSVDTSILLCGLLTCRRHFEEHSEIS
ncbi:MAG: hypothetical protein WBZ11_15050, partial [Candidatus Sulfotelmatobacter sp.]